MQKQQTLVDRLGGLTPAAIAEPRQRARDKANEIGLSVTFRDWLEENWQIWDEFSRLSDQMRLRGRTYYSARAVIHVLRWHRALRDPTETEFKINNNRSAGLARLYNALLGKEFFRTRNSGDID
jgi:hypothetical protein